MLDLKLLQPTDAAAENHARPGRLELAGLQSRIGSGHLGGGEAELRKPVHAFGAAVLDEIIGVEVKALTADLNIVRRGIEAADAADARAAGDQRIPECADGSPQGGNHTQPCYDNPAIAHGFILPVA